MYKFKYKIAGYVIEAETQYEYSSIVCKPFATNDDPDFHLTISSSDVLLDSSEDYNYRDFACKDVGIYESIVLFKKTADIFLDANILLMHGAAISLGKEALIFSGESGVGKTTHIFKWLQHFPEMQIINGDKPFIRFDELPIACGSPWSGKESICSNAMVPLKSIILMERAEDSHIEQISFAQAFPSLLQQVYRPDDEDKMRRTLHLMQRLNPVVSFWRFKCNNTKDDCVEVAYNTLMREKS